MAQTLLFPDPRPLDERFGAKFFRLLPERPGVYLMRDAGDTVLYVGKAKNLRRRLGNYRIANPDRMPRRHLRLLRAVARIELQECPDERSALAREAELLRALKPRFNRAGTWQGSPKLLVWRQAEQNLELAIVDSPREGWTQHGPTGLAAVGLRAVLVRLLWFAVRPGVGLAGMPAGWARGRFGAVLSLGCGDRCSTASAFLEKWKAGDSGPLVEWVRASIPIDMPLFEKAVIEGDLEDIADTPKRAVGV